MKRAVAAACVLAVQSSAIASPFSGWRELGLAVRRSNMLHPGGQKSPVEATGFTPAPHPGELPVPDVNSDRFILRNADRSKREKSRVTASGDVQFAYKGYECRCDRVDGDTETSIFTLEGNVEIIGNDRTLHVERAVVDFEKRTVAFEQGTADLGPAALGGALAGRLYLKGAYGGGSESRATGGPLSLTTCEYDHPHWEFDGRRSVVIPGKRAVLRGVKVKILGRTVFNLPAVDIPLNRRADRYTPEIGQSRDEGYYVKNRIGIPLHGADIVTSRIDYFSKLGSGLGADYQYEGKGVAGLLRAYELPGRTKSQLYSVDHRQTLFGGTLRSEGQWIQNNYLTAPNNRTYNARTAWSMVTRGGRLAISGVRSGNKTTNFGSINQVLSLQHDQNWTKALRTGLTFDVTTNRSGVAGQVIERKVANVRFQGTDDLDFAQAQLEYQRQIPIGRQANFFSALDRTPVFSLITDSRRLWGPKTGGRVPLRLETSLGEMADSQSQHRYTRTSFDLSSTNNRDLGKGSSTNYNLRYKQGFYSNDTALYTLAADTGLRLGLGGKSSLDLRYNYLNPFGFSPLNIDRSGRTDEISSALQWQVHRTWSLAAQTSYDFLQLDRKSVAWQNVGVRSEWTPNNKLLVRTNANYDPFNQWWSNIRFDAGWKVSKGYISTGLRYDGPRHRWGNVNLLADGLEWKRLRASALLNYNGYSNKVEAWQLSMTYDLHCAEAILQIADQRVGFRSGREISFFIRLKALPFDTPFGIGRRGQGLGTGTGLGF